MTQEIDDFIREIGRDWPWPDPDSGLDALSGYVDQILPSVRDFVLDGQHGVPQLDDARWDNLLDVTGWSKLTRADSFLSAKAHRWAALQEPQITRGWVHFLTERHRLARCQAAFAATYGDGQAPALVAMDMVEAEHKNIDILIVARDRSGGQHGLCIEAKFGHLATAEQLRAYREHTDTMELCTCRHLLIAPGLRPDVMDALAEAQDWAFCSWQDWLIHYDNALPPDADDEDFRRFRKTVFEHA